ncbi:permease prefix domain 1-containing protein [Paenibacillus filicis]|uniref:Permease prefix domain 1-containing protein n=1 Tax=Paenibacillus filicis TaxID=669464 RepID=A0ABU9DRP0_9BACL
METIIAYLDNIFETLPRTSQVLKLKQDLLASMEEKYEELRSEGKSKHEAIGIVISEFGNIDELISELDIRQTPQSQEELLPYVTEEEAESFIAAKRNSGLWVGIGVSLCIAGAAALILIIVLTEQYSLRLGFGENAGAMFGLIALILLVAPAIGIFIYSGTRMEKYEYLKGGFELPYYLKAELEQRKASFASTHTLAVITGVSLCVLSPVAIFLAAALEGDASSYGIVVMLAMVAVAVFLFIYYGSIKNSYSMLLKIGEYSEKKQEEDRVIGSIAAVVWPIATCIFLISGLVFKQWHINWIIFPITAILFGAFSASYNILKRKS